MPAKNITKIYLAFTREFRFNPNDKDLHSKYDFLADKRSYFDKVVKDAQYLGKKDLSIEKLGKIRSALDLSGNPSEADNFFQHFQEYYSYLAGKGPYLIPHYPCVIDILPTSDTKYAIDLSTFPGSLKDAKLAKISASIRLYPIGLGSLKFGLFLMTEKSFDIHDVIEFLIQKNGRILVTNLGEEYTVDRLTRVYAESLLQALYKNKKPFSWDSTYSFVDIIESEPLSLESNFEDFFLPITCLGKEPKDKEHVPENQARDGDVLLFGERSAVSYLPGTLDGDRLMNPSRRKLRRWVKNSTELFSAQQVACNFVSTSAVTRTLDALRSKYWVEKMKDGILPPPLEELYSYGNYTGLHNQGTPLCKKEWRDRHSELIRMLDPENRIAEALKQSNEQLVAISEQASDAQHDVARSLKTANDTVKEYVELMKTNASKS